MDVSEYTTKELEQDLNKRKARVNQPQPLEDPDYAAIIRAAQDYIDSISGKKHYKDSNWIEGVFDIVMKAIYGEKIYAYINTMLYGETYGT